MSHYSRLIAKAMGASEAWLELLFNAAPMHDIGKIGIPDYILQSREGLDDKGVENHVTPSALWRRDHWGAPL